MIAGFEPGEAAEIIESQRVHFYPSGLWSSLAECGSNYRTKFGGGAEIGA